MCRAEGDLEACWNRILTIFDPYTFLHSQGHRLTNQYLGRHRRDVTALHSATDQPTDCSANGAVCHQACVRLTGRASSIAVIKSIENSVISSLNFPHLSVELAALDRASVAQMRRLGTEAPQVTKYVLQPLPCHKQSYPLATSTVQRDNAGPPYLLWANPIPDN